MGLISREQFLQQQEAKKERANNFSSGPRVGYFKLNNDGDEAVVRFCDATPDDFSIVNTHKTTVDGKFRRVNCLREDSYDVSKCPFCQAKNPVQSRFYIKLIEYTRGEDGQIIATPKIWERPVSYIFELSDKYNEYGGKLSDHIFKVKRNGEAGDMKTTYSINYANPNIYNSTLYPMVEGAFDGYKIIGGPVLDKTYDELKTMVSSSATVANTAQPANSIDIPTQPTEYAPIATAAPRRITY